MENLPGDYLEAAAQGPLFWVRVKGRGNFRLAPTLKTAALGAIQRGCRRLRVDLRDCTALDSTFQGVLAGLALQLRALGGSAAVLNPGPQARNTLATLGLDRLLDPPTGEDAAAPPPPSLQRLAPAPDVASTATCILAAHEDLIAAAPENQPRFQEVVDQLRTELDRPA